jgi:hypothetical protein
MSALLEATPKKDKVKILKSLSETHHDCLYRFFPKKSEAEALVSGKVWVSTLEACRGYDDPARGDAGEGTIEYNSGTISGDGSDPRLQMIAARSGIGGIGPGAKNISISNVTHSMRIPDAFVLCTTEKYSPDDMKDGIGSYCVKITDPNRFFKKVTRRLAEEYHLNLAKINKVSYSKRHYTGTEPMFISHIGFVKPNIDIYTSQNEVRMLWELKKHINIKPFLLDCPEIKKFCTLV